jgi:hypothetical protein
MEHRMERRAFVRLTTAALVMAPLDRLLWAGGDAALPAASVETLRALAPVVLPAALGRRALGLLTDRFLERLQEHRPGTEADYGYGHPVLQRTPDSPAPRYIEQLAALERAAGPQGQPFGRLAADAKRTIIENALREAKVEQLPDLPDGGHVVSDLMAFYFRSSEANDYCYRAQIGRETCRPLEAVTVRPRPLR